MRLSFCHQPSLLGHSGFRAKLDRFDPNKNNKYFDLFCADYRNRANSMVLQKYGIFYFVSKVGQNELITDISEIEI